jgi:DNA mismatch repair protein MutL
MDKETYRNPARDFTADSPRQVSVLPDELSNKIAAGEVVERPASVVKELMENSLDAGASRIEVAIAEGGREAIRVRDNGCGMQREDLLRAIERHATSKVSSMEDLAEIGTLGFRGEAVPSIGAVSKMEIQSKPHGELSGTRVYVEGGALEEVEEVGVKAGTEVRVDELFFNTPARRKFMKTPRAESRRITEMMVRISLSRPDVKFVLKRDGKVRLDLPAVEDVRDRVLEVMGRDVYDALYETYPYPAINGVVARGYFSEPGHSQRTSKNIYTYVNGRYVDDATVRAAINKAYGSLLDGGRYPSVVLYLDVPFELVDVNVHPMKTEVRFDDTQPIFRAVYHAIGDALADSPWVDDEGDRVYSLDGEDEDEEADGDGEDRGTGGDVSPDMASFEPLNARHRRQSQQDGSGSGQGGGSKNWSRTRRQGSGADGDEVASPFFERGDDQTGFSARGAQPLREPPRVDSGEVGEAPPEDGESGDYFSSLKVIGQFKRAYIVCEDRSGLVVIDQHAAHERIGYERLRTLYQKDNKETQSLLFGQRLELDAMQADTLQEHLDVFENAGFEIEPFGGQSFALKSVPVVLEDADHEALVRDTIDELSELGTSDVVDEALDAVLSRMACHSVVRGPTELTREECEGLLEQMDQIDFKANCPHGRPVYFRIPLMELEKSFDRR